MPKTRRYAISIKQPWATLLVRGVKRVEVRAWPTARRGAVLIHAARVPDPRPEAWALLPERLRAEAELAGGIIGWAVLTGCIAYQSSEEFLAAQAEHLNDPSWFRPPVLYGFTFADPVPLPFRRLPGWMRFFPVDESDP
jgi:hypothetical protein